MKSSLLSVAKHIAKIVALIFATIVSLWLLGHAIRRLKSARRARDRESVRTSLEVACDAWFTTRGGISAIKARQQTRLADLVAHARASSPFYHDLYRDLPWHITDVRQLPPVTKQELMAHFDDWVTDPRVTRDSVDAFIADKSLIGHPFLARYAVWTTSGSTGEPAILVQDPGALGVLYGLRYVRALPAWITVRNLWKIVRGRGHSAGLLLTGGHYGAVALSEHEFLKHPWRARITRIYSVLSPLSEIVEGLNAFQPVILGGYATAISLLAQEQMAGRLRIRPVLLTVTAEWLAPAERKRVESVFDCHVWNGYAASEAPAIAFDCKYGHLHVNADWFILEPVDRNYQPVPPGQPSHTVLVTNLTNRVQPIIRYDLGDSVTLRPDPCPCGSPLPAIDVEGRTDEILSFPTTRGEPVRVLPMALASVVEETPGVRRFQIVQTAPDALTIRLEPIPTTNAEQVWDAVKQRLQTYLAAQSVSTIMIERAAELPVRNPKTGKFRHVWSEMKSPI